MYAIDIKTDNYSIVEMNLDGSDKKIIKSFGDTWIYNLNVVDNEWLYFAEEISFNDKTYISTDNLYRMKLDGREMELVPEILNY